MLWLVARMLLSASHSRTVVMQHEVTTMANDLLTKEAKVLAVCLQQMWEHTRHDTDYAARLVALAERAHQRYLRRAACQGDPRARTWLSLMAAVKTRAHMTHPCYSLSPQSSPTTAR
jgi:hypothetical protein